MQESSGAMGDVSVPDVVPRTHSRRHSGTPSVTVPPHASVRYRNSTKRVHANAAASAWYAVGGVSLANAWPGVVALQLVRCTRRSNPRHQRVHRRRWTRATVRRRGQEPFAVPPFAAKRCMLPAIAIRSVPGRVAYTIDAGSIPRIAKTRATASPILLFGVLAPAVMPMRSGPVSGSHSARCSSA